MPYFVVENIIEAMSQRGKPLCGSKVLVLGLAYKRDIDDLRESPSLTIIELLQKRGATVEYNDPFVPAVGRGRKATVSFYVRGVAPVDVAVDVVRASDRVAVAHFAVPGAAPGTVQSVDWDGMIAGVAQPDGRYVFQVAAAIAGGTGVRAAQVSAPAPRRESFWLVHDVFPIAELRLHARRAVVDALPFKPLKV